MKLDDINLKTVEIDGHDSNYWGNGDHGDDLQAYISWAELRDESRELTEEELDELQNDPGYDEFVYEFWFQNC